MSTPTMNTLEVRRNMQSRLIRILADLAITETECDAGQVMPAEDLGRIEEARKLIATAMRGLIR